AHEEQQHDRAVHREQFVVPILRYEVLLRAGELDSHRLGHRPTDAEADERGPYVGDTNALVVGGGAPRQDAGGLVVRFGLRRGDGGTVFEDRHDVCFEWSQESNSSGGRARTRKVIFEWSRPQNSEHTPGHSPTSVRRTSIALWTLGMRSRFSFNFGAQNEWMTSLLTRSRRTVRPVGSTSTGVSPGTPVICTPSPS